MRMSEILKSSLATLRMNGRRTFLTMFGIVIGIASVITILSLGNGFQKETLDSLAKDEQGRRSQEFYFNMSVIDIDPSQLNPFSQKNVDEIMAFQGVDEVTLTGEAVTQQYVSVSYQRESEYYNADILESTNHQMISGRNLNSSDSKAGMPYVIIDQSLAMTLFGDMDNSIHKSLTIDQNNYTIVGVYASDMPMMEDDMFGMMGPMSQLVIPSGTFQRYSTQSGFNYSMTVYYHDQADMKQINRQIGDYLQENGQEKDNGSYEYYDATEMMDQIGQQLQMITYFISAIAGISLFIAGVGVMNMMYISVAERTKEIGIRRSLGATKRSIQWQFLLEGIAITSLGGIIGYSLGMGLAILISRFIPFNAVFDIPTAVFSAAISVIIGIVFSVFPARQAARKNVVEILR